MPSHRDKPEGFDAAARRRSQEVDEAVERARRQRLRAYASQLSSKDRARGAGACRRRSDELAARPRSEPATP